MLATSFIDFAHNAGYPLLFLLVMAESGGIPVPGETSLIAAAALASQGKLEIQVVIVIAACAAITGDNLGYLFARKAGRWALERPGRFERQRHQVLAIGEPFFAKHGPKAVFFGRFLLGLRVWASWLAGATRMPWRSFAVWNAAGGISWAVTIGLIAYFIGQSAGNAVTKFGIYGLVVLVLALAGLFVLHRRHRTTLAARTTAGELDDGRSRESASSQESDGRAGAAPEEGPDAGADDKSPAPRLSRGASRG